MKSYQEKRKQFSSEAQKRISDRALEIKRELHILKTIREITGMSQDALAERLGVGQSYISRLERRDNITLATLANIVRALGGSIEIAIHLPEREPVKLKNLEALFALDAQHDSLEQERS
ncbi:helix-turn-helix domain-containing protein [Scytonema sp. UIC 10036]|uniref:helix-turn-helix domain-containing protein n=1 Tax=Scytonema sp. UIC 10036 TaxID=2304196 RepID=UPI0012DA61F7|nr:helix-turn-helix transcriptional regulator [Scytonema sp. UIC 10036]MUH00568.1 helix-turn-helix domain-containing protein [Scytonema sp. UIC 10036]